MMLNQGGKKMDENEAIFVKIYKTLLLEAKKRVLGIMTYKALDDLLKK